MNRIPDINLMNQACEVLKKHKDFTSFSKSKTDTKTNLCDIYFAKWNRIDDKLIFEIQANRFLRNMVRAIVGTLFEVGKNRISINDFEQIILKKNRSFAGGSVPAKGLFLTDIKYPDNFTEVIQ